MTGSRIWTVAHKEFRHIMRDPRSLWIIFMLPNILMFLFGYAINLDIKNIRLGVCDQSGTPLSRELVRTIEGSSYFTIAERFDAPRDVGALFERRAIRAAVLIPRDFAVTLEREGRAGVGVVIDGSDANSASIIQNYLETLLATTPVGRWGTIAAPVSLRTTVFYNREMNSKNFIVPGLVAVVMMMLGALLTSITIAREKETGTLEQILVSPIKPYEVIAGKVIPYLALACLVAAMIVTVGHFWFKVPFVGSAVSLALYSILYLLTALSLGLLISTVVSTQQVAIMLSLILTLLPTIMLSGFIFPVASMPRILRMLSAILPATHFLVIARGVMLKGSTLADVWPQAAALVGIGAILAGLAVKRFSLKLSTKGGRA